MPTTIGRNRRQYMINIKAEFTRCLKHDPETDTWVTADPSEAWDVLALQKARLIEDDDRRSYTIRHGTQVYMLTKPTE